MKAFSKSSEARPTPREAAAQRPWKRNRSATRSGFSQQWAPSRRIRWSSALTKPAKSCGNTRNMART